MKLNRPTIWTPPEPVQEHESTKPVGKVVDEKPAEPELQRKPSMKTDSVEMKQNSTAIVDKTASRSTLVPAPPSGLIGMFGGPMGSMLPGTTVPPRPAPLELQRNPSPKTDSVEVKSVELQRNPSPKTDSVEMNQNSSVILDNVASKPKLDPSQVNLNKGNEVSAALLPGVPFREKVELPKTLPKGTSVDSGVGSGDLGLGKTRPGPNHMGVDLRGNEIRNQLNDALNLREGGGSASSAPPSATVNSTGFAGKPGTSAGDSTMSASGKTQATYDAGFDRPGMGMISATTTKWTKDENGNQVKETMGTVPNGTVTEKTTYKGGGSFETDRTITYAGGIGFEKTNITRDKDGNYKQDTTILDENGKPISGSVSTVSKDGTVSTVKKKYDEDGNEIKPDTGSSSTEKEYVDPEGGPAVGTTITPEALERAVSLREGANTTPSNTDDQGPIVIDPKRVFDPMKDPLVTDKNPDMQESADLSHLPEYLRIKEGAEGPDGVNPNDPEVSGGGTPPVPKG